MTIATGDQALAADVVKLGASLYGDGSDGDVTITGTPTTITKDMFYNNLTINAGKQLETDGYIVHVKGTLAFADATAKIICNGNDGAAGTGGAAHSGPLKGGKGGNTPGGSDSGAGGGGASSVLVFAKDITGAGTLEAIGGDGQAGAVSNSATPGSVGSSVTRGAATGGAGGTAGQPGGSGGTTTPSTATFHQQESGGGGGGSGGETTPQSGGGGGGGGGNIIVVYQTKAAGLTLTATGGSGGAGSGAGAAGTNGSAGITLELFN